MEEMASSDRAGIMDWENTVNRGRGRGKHELVSSQTSFFIIILVSFQIQTFIENEDWPPHGQLLLATIKKNYQLAKKGIVILVGGFW